MASLARVVGNWSLVALPLRRVVREPRRLGREAPNARAPRQPYGGPPRALAWNQLRLMGLRRNGLHLLTMLDRLRLICLAMTIRLCRSAYADRRVNADTVVRMDIAAVTEGVTELLTPFIGLLRRAATTAVDQAAEETGNRIGAKSWTLAKEVWARLRHRVMADPALNTATESLATAPADPVAREALRHHLERVLTGDPSLLRDLDHLLTAGTTSQQVNTATELNIGVQAGSIHGGTVTGVGKQADRDQ